MDADTDPDSAFDFEKDPDPDPTFHSDADPDPQQCPLVLFLIEIICKCMFEVRSIQAFCSFFLYFLAIL